MKLFIILLVLLVVVNARLLSFRKRTRQSSTGWGGKSSRAVDGSTQGHYGRRSCTHTKGGRGHQWWRVYFRRPHRIHRVFVFNRTDCCRGRINGVRVYAGGKFCGRLRGSRRVHRVHCRGHRARHVTLRKKGGYLTLCEVKVYGH